MSELEEIASAVKDGNAVLFVGAGATVEGGGLSWANLSKYVAEKLQVAVPDDPARAFDEICYHRNLRVEAYSIVQARLSSVHSPTALGTLLRLPWLALVTTNYDTAIEDFLNEQGFVRPNTVLANEPALQLRTDIEVPVLKIMGCRTAMIGEPGEMTLSSIDYVDHQGDRAVLLKHLDVLSRTRVIVSVGSSFTDNVLLDAVKRVRAFKRNSRARIFAVFKPGSTGPVIDELRSFGVAIIESELSTFSESLSKTVDVTRSEPKTTARFRGAPISIPVRALRDTERAFEIVRESDCVEGTQLFRFLRGDTTSLAAYEGKFAWQRSALKFGRDALSEWRRVPQTRFCVVDFSGRPGSGRTVAGMDLLHYAVTEFPSLGLRVPAWSPRLDELGVRQALAALRELPGDFPGKFLSIYVTSEVSPEEIRLVLGHLDATDNSGTPILVIRAGDTPLDSRSFNQNSVTVRGLELADQVGNSELDSLVTYLDKLPPGILSVRLPRSALQQAAAAEPSFFELLYAMVNPSRERLTDTVLREYHALGGLERKAVDTVAIGHLAGVPVPLSIVASVARTDYPGTFDLLDRCSKLTVIDYPDGRIPEIRFFHRRVGDIILSALKSTADAKGVVSRVVREADLANFPEYQLIVRLFVEPGERQGPIDRILTAQEALELMSEVVSAGPSRLLLHRYGLRLRQAHEFEEALRVLQEALATREDENRPSERKEVVLTSLAHTRWLSLKEKGVPDLGANPELLAIRTQLEEARSSTGRRNPHSYAIEGQILTDLSQLASGPQRSELLGEAIAMLEEGLRVTGGYDEFISSNLAETLRLAGGLSEPDARSLLTEHGLGTGYYILYERAAERGEAGGGTAQRFLELAVDAPITSVPALRAKIDFILSGTNPDYLRAKKLSDKLLNLSLSQPTAVRLRWIDSLQRLVCSVATGDTSELGYLIHTTITHAPHDLPRPVLYFHRSQGRTTEFHGRVREITGEFSGWIGEHDAPGNREPLFFNPGRSKNPGTLRRGDSVVFNLAFGIRGPQAYDVQGA